VIAGLWAVLLASVVGSLHCLVMCGPLLALHHHGGATERWRSAALHQLGRLLGYATLGALAGSAGRVVDLAGTALAVQRAALFAAAAVLLGWSVMLGWRAWGRSARPTTANPASGMWARGLVQLRRQPPARRALGLGVLNAALPCGWLWAFVTVAASTGSPSRGVATMIVFWLGTLPALLGWTALATPLVARLKPRWPMVTAGLVLGLAGAALLLRLPLLHGRPGEAPSCHSSTVPLTATRTATTPPSPGHAAAALPQGSP
jgi:uncharacterized protein